METRDVITTQCRIYGLVLNNFGAAEDGEVVALPDDHDRLIHWYEDQFAEKPYRDGQWYKRFKPGSSIEWFNPCINLNVNDTQPFGHGIHDEWIDVERLPLLQSNYNYV